jgi:Uma2 family endonuclease
MTWKEIIANPTLQNLPFRIETNERGQIVMTPITNHHSRLQATLLFMLAKWLPDGEVLPKCNIATRLGMKVADVVWASSSFMAVHGDEDSYTKAPELCIEVLSPSNSSSEMQEKRTLYFEEGALEFWLCDTAGRLSFFGPEIKLERSLLCPEFPEQTSL